MSKNERNIDVFRPKKPSPTPEQLQNSIDELRAMNPDDKRISKYNEMMPEAEKRLEGWQEKVDRIKKSRKSK